MSSSRDLPAVGVVTYNGFTFPTAVQARLQCVNVPGSAGNTTKYNLYTFTIECVVVSEDEYLEPESDAEVTPAADGPIDDNMENIRRRIGVAGAPFRFTSQGLGDDMIVNDLDSADSQWDVAFGPKPRLLAWEPMGSNRAARVIWLCEVALSECEDFTLTTTGPGGGSVLSAIDYSYDMTWDIEDGLHNRTIRGTLEIGTTALEFDNTPFSVADQYWDYVYGKFPELFGFKRKTSRTLSRDGRVLEFVIVDHELPSEFPLLAGAIEIEADYGVSSNLQPLGFYTWNAEFSGTIKLAPQVERWKAWNMFLILLNSRYSRAFGWTRRKSANGSFYYTLDRIPYVTEFSMNESLYTREYSFSVSWMFFASIGDVFRFAGIFGDLTSATLAPLNPNWNDWENSMALYGPKSARGWARMGGLQTDVRRNDPCGIQRLGLPTVNNIAAKQTITTFYPLFTILPGQISKEQSYLYGEFETEFFQGKNTSQTTPNTAVPPTEITPSQTQNNNSGSGTVLDQTQTNDSTASLIQVRGPSRNTLILRGILVRASYPVQVPKIISIGGKAVYQTFLRIKTKVMAGAAFPIFTTAFEIGYLMDSPPTGDIVLDVQTDANEERYT